MGLLTGNGNGQADTYSSFTVNGQLIPVFTGMGFNDVGNAVGPTLYGYGNNTPQTIPLAPGSSAVGASPTAGLGSFQLTTSHAIVLGVMLIIGVAGLRYIHWRA